MRTERQKFEENWGKKIRGKLLAENAINLEDKTLERILSVCVAGHRLVPLAKKLRDRGDLKLWSVQQ